MISGVVFTEYTKDFLDLSTDWLSDPEIKQLTMTPDIDPQAQKKWFDSLKERDDYYIFGITCDNRPIGAVGLKNFDPILGEGEYWGYIGEKEYIGRGIGNAMVDHIVNLAIRLKITRLYLKVWDQNTRAIKLYEKKGFSVFNKEDGVIYMEKNVQAALR